MDAVISFPKSGRTWLRVMLDQYGLPLEWTHAGAGHGNGRPISKLDTSTARKYGRILFLHRDPRDTAVSGYYQKLYRRDGYSGTISEFLRDPCHGLEKIILYNRMWLELASRRPQMMVVSYENLRVDTEAELAEIIAFFGAEVDRGRIHQVVADSTFERMQQKEKAGEYASVYGKILSPADPGQPDSYKVRKGVVGGYVDELSSDDVTYCDQLVERLNGVVGANG
ncbi:MAG: sulfotransferase domain-containing protein [Cyanobium sp. M30B3]|jgi:hypothetical protein|nr:MAG: sulfotransferase domain-containing protein [Cyanobium sp. M30B3]